MKALKMGILATTSRSLAVCVFLVAANAMAAEITGTAFSIVVRNVQQAQVPQQQPRRPSTYAAPVPTGLLRLVDVRSRREIGRANWDTQLGGYFFQLPLVGLPSAPPICLALVDQYNRTVPVRDVRGNDPGTSFAHPKWDELLGRSRELADLKAEQAALQLQRQRAGEELARLQAEAAAAGATVPGSCVAPPALQPPARPLDAIETQAAERASGPLCALRWEQALGAKAPLGRLFSEAGLTADWDARSGARDLADRLQGVQLDVSKSDAETIQDAALTGRSYLNHAEGIKRLQAAHDRCRRSVVALVERARGQWLQQVDAARAQPERERQQCEARIPRIAQLRQSEGKAAEYAALLERQINDHMRPASSTSPESIGQQACQL